MDNKTEKTLAGIKNEIDKLSGSIEQLLLEAKLEGFREGYSKSKKLKPTHRQFKEDHKDPVMYGEDYAYVVYATTRKKAAELLGTEEEYVEEVGIGWEAYEIDGDFTVGYYMGRDTTPEWTAYGVYC